MHVRHIVTFFGEHQWDEFQSTVVIGENTENGSNDFIESINLAPLRAKRNMQR